ncbi:hypothetical protein GH714_023355 [Hevea brasiliensis]|uniref:C3H1-type domain-containing protein n=1 Tax=Hevea brasiliensis TaxID=3981 RepID=A0A6A6LU38_HEVBR|nr:hypothetical protein GH714_023355 [Hevea brasiliensis]
MPSLDIFAGLLVMERTSFEDLVMGLFLHVLICFISRVWYSGGSLVVWVDGQLLGHHSSYGCHPTIGYKRVRCHELRPSSPPMTGVEDGKAMFVRLCDPTVGWGSGRRSFVILKFVVRVVISSLFTVTSLALDQVGRQRCKKVAAKHNLDFASMGYLDSVSELQNQNHFLSLEDQIEPVNLGNMVFPSDYFSSDAALGSLSARAGRRYSSLNEIPVKTCHYFNKGFCKHGSNCRYYHGQVSESFPRTFDANNEDQLFSPGSLEKLELEIIEILKSRKGNPVSIASLPMIYYEKYGKVLQAEGYLTESQRHGKAGYSLTKLLIRLKNSIQLIDRPHGQHAVILVEDAPKYMDNRGDRNDPGPIVSGSRQIYLTFPAESTFTEDDVSNYFNTFGSVEDLKFWCRRYQERIEPPFYFSSQYVDTDSEFYPMRRGYETSRLLRKQLMEEQQEQALEIQRRRFAELRTAQKPMSNQSYFGYSMEGLKVSEDNFNLPSTERLSHLIDVLNIGSVSDDTFRHTETNYMDPDSQGLNLPESPFASPIASSISTVI